MRIYRKKIKQTALLFKDVFENMDYKNLSALKEMLGHNAMNARPLHTYIGESDKQGKNICTYQLISKAK